MSSAPNATQQDNSAVLAEAVAMMAKESRRSRKQRKGEDASSSDDDEKKAPFDLTKSLDEYGLGGIPPAHRPRVKLVKPIVTKMKKKFDEGEKDLVSENVLEFIPQWMKNPPKDLKPKHLGGTMSHQEWVAAWWSRRWCS